MTREEFIQQNAYLFWYMPKESLPELSNDVLVEFIFNYGTWESVKQICEIIGFQNLKEVYQNVQGRRVGNYFPETYNFLKLMVEKYAS